MSTPHQKKAARRAWVLAHGDDARFEVYWQAYEQEAGMVQPSREEIPEREAAEARAFLRRNA